jgi:hypothetical protein
MLLTFDALMERLNHPRNSMRNERKAPAERTEIELEVRKLQQGRKKGDLGYSDEMRINTGALARVVGPTEAAEISGMTQANASYLKRAYSSSLERSKELDLKIKNKLAEKVDDAKDAALDKLLSSIGNIGEDKLKDLKPKALASIAKDLATVVDKVSSDNGREGGHLRVIINTVGQKDEDDYPTIEVGM